MLKIANNKGFQLTFSNGLTISVQFGSGNYCCRQDSSPDAVSEMSFPMVQSHDAEIAIWDAAGVWWNFGEDNVLGYVSTDDVGEWIDRVRRSHTLEELADR